MTIERIKWNHAGFREILRSGTVEAEVRRRANLIASQAGDGFEASSTVGRNRALAMVWADTPEARSAEATERRLTRSIDAGRR